MYMRNYWLSIEFEEEHTIESLRDEIYDRIETDIYQKETEPHLTFHPGFRVPDEFHLYIKNKVDDLDIEGQSLEVDGFHIYPSIDNPQVVSLDVKTSLSQERDKFQEILDEYDGDELIAPVNPHITLFRISGVSDSKNITIPEDDKDSLEVLRNEAQVPSELTVSNVKFENK